MIYWRKCPSTSSREKYPKKIKNSETVECIGISMKNYPKSFWISPIDHRIQVENACWKSAFLKSRNHELSRNNLIYIYIDFIIYTLNSVELYGSQISKKPTFSIRFPLEICGRFGWFKILSGSFAWWFRCTKSFQNFLFSWGPQLGYFSLSEVDGHFRQYIIATLG